MTEAASRSASGWFTLDRTIAAIVFVGIAFAACFTPAQGDTWWHLRAGQESWRAGGAVLRDTFSHTAYGVHWTNQEWLGEVMLYGLYAAGGLPLMTLFAAGLAVVSWVLIWRVTPGGAVERALLCGVAVMASSGEWSLRPKIFTLFFLALTIFLIVRRQQIWLPPLFAVWANLHGGVMLGIVVLIAAAAANSLCERRLWNSMTVAALASSLLTNATPLGFSLWPSVVASLGRIRQLGIREWSPPGLLDSAFLPFWLMSGALIAVAVRAEAWRPELGKSTIVWPALVMLPFAVRAGRNVPPALMLAVPALGLLLTSPAQAAGQRRVSPERPLINLAFVSVASVAAAAVVLFAWTRRDPRLGWDPLPAAAAHAISACPERLYNRYDEGGYVIWFAPTQKVFIDGRQDPFPPALLLAQRQVEQTGEYAALFREHEIRCAFVPSRSVLAARLRHDGWAPRFVDATWSVLAAPESASAGR